MVPEQFNCFIIGNGSLVIPCGEYILEKGSGILGVVTSEEDIIFWCNEKKIRVIAEDSLDELKKSTFDFLFSIVYLKLIPADIIKLPKKLAINYHDALLPEYAGIHATSWSIINGEKMHGITWHVMQEKLDTGSILVQKQVEIQEDETAVSLNLKCFQAALEGFYELTDGIQRGSLKKEKQDLSRRSYFGKWKKPSNAGLIDWCKKTEKILCFVHGLTFGPYQNTLASAKISYKGKFYIIEDIEKSTGSSSGKPGIARIYEDGLVVSTKDSFVIIRNVKTLTGDFICISDIFGKPGETCNLLFDKSAADKLEHKMNTISKNEPYWLKKLLGTKSDFREFAVTVEAADKNKELRDLGKNSLEKILILLRNGLEKSNVTGEYFIGYCSGEHTSDALFADIVPFRIRINKNDSSEQIVADLREEISVIEKKCTFVRDIYYRYEELKDKEFKPQIVIYNRHTEDLSKNEFADISFFIEEEMNSMGFACRDKKYEAFAEHIIEKSEKRKSGFMNKIEEQRKESFISTYQLISRQAEICDNKVAVFSGEDKITYGELIEKVNMRAGIFHKNGICRGMNIGVLLHRSYENIVSFLAIMKLGAVYIPMDSTYPKERLDYMAADGEIKYLVTESGLSMKLSEGTFKYIYIDKENKDILIETQAVKLQPKDPVYILYTSGSTGKPKGVIVNHLGLSNFLLSMQKEPGFTKEDKLMSLTTVCFDISGLEMYLPLISGGQVEIIPSEVINDGIVLKERLEASDATVIQATPATWNMLLMAGWESKLNIKILCGGENLSIELADKLLKQCNELWNMYGPTETTIWSTIKQVVDKNKITIGKPIRNTTVYIFDKNNRKVNDSQTGELYIGGDGVSNGYYKRNEITSERFIDNPVNPGEIIYKTGDLAKIDDKGDLIYLGRLDNQVKYHGYRIELEEIEKVIQEKLNLDKAVAVLRKDSLGEDSLYAFIQSKSEIEIEKELVTLGKFLPHYMLPGEIISLTTFPLTANKKINRKILVSLPIEDIIDKYRMNDVEMNVAESKAGDTSADTSLNEILKIVAEVIRRDVKDIDVDKNLSTYGYNSIRYTVLSTKLNKQLDVKITPALCYTYKTVRELAHYIDSDNTSCKAPAKSGAVQAVQIDNRELKERLRTIAAEIIKKDVNTINLNEPLSTYGFNSIRYTVLCTKINRELGTKVTPALCYRYRSIGELVGYMNDEYDISISKAAAQECNIEQNPIEVKAEDKAEVKTHVHKEEVKDRIRRVAAEVIKKSPEEIGTDVSLSHYGFNSIRYTVLCTKLNRELGILITPVLCYQYRTIDELTDYLNGGATSTTALVKESPGPKAKDVYDTQTDDVAIIGIGAHFPKADSLEEIWKILEDGECVVGKIPKDRWNLEMYKQYDDKYPSYGAFMNDIWSFDPEFFHLAPRETIQIDPQQRLFLVTSWEAIEDAGYNPEELAGENVAVYVGTVDSDYYNRLSRNIAQADIFTLSGNIQCGIANRVSYMFDFHGESETINTACSSSLVALDHAVKAIRKKECSLAIAGGVNIILNPFMHYALKKNGMLSPDGRCKSFDEEANGYVRGEGCGAILLKPLKEARRDGDHVYGVIRGSVVNHDGKTNSFTAPNPVIQAELIVNAYNKAGIRPDYVSYIETHGTGTKLGDPIEINALKDGFDRLYSEFNIPKKTNYCALGAMKANIGHLEAAAGIAGVIKVLLCMQKHMLPQVAYLKEVNPYIALDNSPFYILRENQKWMGIKDDAGERRHIAGISSFGFGGSNAHVVLEAYNDTETAEQPPMESQAFVLSANTKEGLKKYAKALKKYVENEIVINGESKFNNIAYTLQTGRKVCEYRAAFIVGSLAELAELIGTYISDKTDNRIIEGNGEKDRTISAILEGSEGENYIMKLLKNNRFEKISCLWALGAEINWKALYEGKCKKVSLPTYPFAKERYRLESIDSYLDGACMAIENIEKSIIKIAADDYTIKEHVINGNRILPGIKYIDVAIKSCFRNGQTSMHLKSNEWIMPKIVTKDDILEIETDTKSDETVYKIYSRKDDRRILHAKGRAVAEDEIEETENIDIEAVRTSFSKRLSKEQIYDKYRELGYNYGTMFKPLESVYYSEKEALSRIHITDEIRKKAESGTISIGLFEGGMQAVIGCLYNNNFKLNFMPSCIKDCYIHTLEVPEYAYGYARLVNSVQTDQGITKEFDIRITDEFGKVIIELLGYVLSAVTKKARLKDENKTESNFFLNKKITESGIDTSRIEAFRDLKILAVNDTLGGSEKILKKLSEKNRVDCIDVSDIGNEKLTGKKVDETDIVLVFSDYQNENGKNTYQQLAELSKILINSHFNGRLIYLFEDNTEAFHCYEKAVEGFAKCYQNETVHSVMKVIQADTIENVIDSIVADIVSDNHVFVSYKNGRRYITEYVQAKECHQEDLIKDKEGVYVITGGIGHIGLQLAKELSTRYPDIRIVLLGRNGLNGKEEEFPDCIKKQIYVMKADVTDYIQVTEAFEEINTSYGVIKGVFHAAGAIDDCYIKDRTDFNADKVIGPKVNGIMNVDLALKDQEVDFFVLFSSISAVTGNAGQADYCYANSFLDSFAEFRNTMVERQCRNGKTISINWGIWRDGGMKLPEIEMQSLKKNTGIEPIETEGALKILLAMDISEITNICVVNGNEEMFLDYVNKTKEAHEKKKAKAVLNLNMDEKLMDILKECCFKVIGIDRNKLIENKEFSDYGFDSLTNTLLADEINEKLGLDITPVAFFEFTCLESLGKYLKEEYKEILEKHFIPEENAEALEKDEDVDEAKQGEMKSSYKMSFDMPYVSAHTVFGEPVILGVTYIGQLYQSLIKMDIGYGEGSFKNVLFHEPVTVNKGESVLFKTSYSRKNGTLSFLETCEKKGEEFTAATGIFTFGRIEESVTEDWKAVVINADRVIEGNHIYAHKWKYDVNYSEVLQSVDKLYIKDDIAIGKLVLKPEMRKIPYEVNPAILDASMICGLYAFLENVKESYIPYMIKSVVVNSRLTEDCYCICRKNTLNDEFIYMDITIMEENGNVLCAMKDFICKKVMVKAQFEKAERNRLKEKQEAVSNKDIAVVGMSASFAGSKSVGEYWNNLIERKDLIREIPTDHFKYKKYYDPESKGDDKMYTKWGGFIEDVDKFDAPFFRISRREAQVMDPQLRLLLQHVYQASEDAGYTGTIRGSKTGMYVGCCFHDYQQKMDRMGMPVSPHDATGNALTMLANRPSYCLDLKGPSINVDTACSSSLVALHMACKGIIHGECDMAFAAGVNLLLDSWHYRYFCSIGALSKTGRCHTFTDQADGYIPGEGVAVVLLKPLSKAIADNDNIYGIIKGSAINHGGLTSSVTAPSIAQEAQVIEDAWKDAKVSAEDISYIEAHGTGTKLGDPIEIGALKHVLNKVKVPEQKCYIGSAKAHIGHTEGAAGLAGLIKVLLSMRHGMIPAMPYFDKINPYINLDKTNIRINRVPVGWKADNGKKIAGISSFGAGGAYAHVVVEEYHSEKRRNALSKPRLIILSAKSAASLRKRCSELISYIENEKDSQRDNVLLKDISYTLMVGREQMNVRMAFVAENLNVMTEKLKSYLAGDTKGIYFNELDEDQLLSLKNTDSTDDLEHVADRWVHDSNIDAHKPIGFEKDEAGRISLPAYPFEEKSYWITEQIERGNTFTVNKNDFFINNHVIEKTNVMPAVAYFDYVINAAGSKIKKECVNFMDINFMSPFKVTGDTKDISVEFDAVGNDFKIKSKDEYEETVHVQGSLSAVMKMEDRFENSNEFENLPNVIQSDRFYEQLNKYGLYIGEEFQTVQKLECSTSRVKAYISLKTKLEDTFDSYILHPAIMDGILQSAISMDNDKKLHIPFEIKTIHLVRNLKKEIIAYCLKDKLSGKWDITVTDTDGYVILVITGLLSREVNSCYEKDAEDSSIIDMLNKLSKGENTINEVNEQLEVLGGW